VSLLSLQILTFPIIDSMNEFHLYRGLYGIRSIWRDRRDSIGVYP